MCSFPERENFVVIGQDKRIAVTAARLDGSIASVKSFDTMLVCVAITHEAQLTFLSQS